MRVGLCYFLLVLTVFGGSLSAQTTTSAPTKGATQDAMDRACSRSPCLNWRRCTEAISTP